MALLQLVSRLGNTVVTSSPSSVPRHNSKGVVMLVNLHRSILLAFAIFAVANVTLAQYAELASKVPATTNALSMMNVEKILASPIAVKEDWKGRFDKAFASGMISIPPHAHQVLLATQLDYETWQSAWDVAIINLTRDVSMSNIARQTKGLPDTIGEFPAVALRQDAYIVAFGKQQVAAMAPANRQAVVRWIRATQSKTKPELAPYLLKAVKLADKIDIVQAFDLEGVVPEAVVSEKVKSSPALAGKKIDAEQLTKLLTSILGVTFEVNFKQDRHARFLIDFDQDAALLATVGKPLLLEVLAGAGARIEDFDTWTPKVEGKQFILTGTLSPAGMRKVLSLIDAPISTFTQADETLRSQADSASQNSQAAYASQAYFKAVESIIDDLRKESKDSVTLGQNAAWFDRWARKIERLPMVGVDKDMLDYGGFVVGQLRGASDSLKGIGINSAQRSAQVYESGQAWVSGDYGSGYYGRYGSASGYYEWNPVDSQRRAIRADERAKGSKDALGGMRQIENATGAIRRTMTERYQIQF